MQASKSSMDLSVQDFLAGYSPEVQTLAKGLRSLIYSVMPNAVERVYPGWKAIWYGPSDGMRAVICVISPLKTSVNLGVSRGIELPDPHKLLSGTGKRIRHVKVQKAEDIANPALRALLEAAVALGGV